MAVAAKPQKATTVRIQNPDAYMDIDTKTGLIRSLVFKKKKVDLFAQRRQNIPPYAAGLRIYDELDQRLYDDLTSPSTVRDVKTDKGGLSFTRQYKDAPFAVKVTMRMDKDAFHWEVTASKKSRKVADRSLRVYFTMPLIAGWHVWGPCHAGEFLFDGMTPFAFTHLQVSYVSPYDICMPMVSHFSKQLDVGYSMMEPMDALVPAAKFQFLNDRAFTWGCMEKPQSKVPMLEAMNYYIGLVGDRPMSTKIMMMFHEGDWRPGVGKVFNRWKKFFVPANPKMYEHEGYFAGCGMGAFCQRQGAGRDFMGMQIPNWVKGKVKTFECHVHFEYYGDYFQEGRDRWIDLIVYENLYRKWGSKNTAHEVYDWVQSHTPQEILAELEGKKPEDYTKEEAEAAIYTTRAAVREQVNALADAGISPFWYFNYTDGFRPIVERRWPDSLSKNEDGSITPSGWMMCHNLNADPKYSFGKFQIASAKKIVQEHPRLAGFFLDCFRHFEVEFGHDDGITVCNNKPAYSINFSYDAIEPKVKKILHEHGMCTFANKPQTIRTMRWVDGMMLEGNGDIPEEKYFWTAIAKPLIFLWTTNENSDDENCRRAVLHGCFPKWEGGEEAMARREKYHAMYEAFRRRIFCFEPDPMRVPKGCRGKLYTVGDDYVAGIVNLHVDEGQHMTYDKPPYAMFRVSRGHDVGRVGMLLPGDRQWRDVPFKFNGTFIAVPLEGFTNCATVKLFVTGNTGKSIGDDKFKGPVDSCGDPDSSFDVKNEM
jgi:hypothetical protein